jgi:nitroreductase
MSSTSTTPTLSGEFLLRALNWRYATKVFDPARKISPSDLATLEQVLVLTPSSFGMQPWKFIFVSDPTLRSKLKPVSWDQSQITDASHLVVFAARAKLNESDVQRHIERVATVRGVPVSSVEGYKQRVVDVMVKGPRSQMAFEWAARQCYIAIGNLMTSAALLGIDTCPLEGIDPAAYDSVLELGSIGYKTVVACALGYRSEGDKYAHAKKVRFPVSEVLITK